MAKKAIALFFCGIVFIFNILVYLDFWTIFILNNAKFAEFSVWRASTVEAPREPNFWIEHWKMMLPVWGFGTILTSIFFLSSFILSFRSRCKILALSGVFLHAAVFVMQFYALATHLPGIWD